MQFLLGLVFPAPGTRLHGQGRTPTCVASDGAPMPEDIVEEENRFKFALLATTLLLFLAYDFLLLLFLCPVLDLTSSASPAGAQSVSFFRATVLAFTAINALLLAFLHTVRHLKVSACCVLVYINVGVWAVSVVCGPISEFLICLVHVPMLGFYQFGHETGVALLGLTLAQSVVYAIACGLELTPTSGHTLELGVTARLLAMMGSFVLLGLTTCVNERARLQALRKYHETNKRLAKATKTKARFLTHVSHELRTPLHGIVAAGEELIEQLHELSLANEMASIIGECSRHMLSLINDVLDFERMATKQMTIERIPFNITEEIESLIKMLVPMAKQKRIELRQIVDVSHPRRVGDPLRFRQMITNLVSNSLKFTPENGSVTIAVSSRRRDGPEAAGGGRRRHAPEGPPQQACVGCCGPGGGQGEEGEQHDEPDDLQSHQQQKKKSTETTSDRAEEEENQVLVEVIDTGIGIPEEHLPFIFKNFTQADASTTRKFGGSGLGLAICKRLARLMGGKVGVHSQRNKGSTFWFTLPLPLADESSGATEEATDASSVLPPRLRQLSVSGETRARREDSLRGVRVLIVEDNAVNLKLGLKMLQRVGCSYIASAGDGEQCLRVLAEQGPFDVILMDCHMPVMDGLEATRRVRAREQALQLKRTPIIALSASTTPDDIATCMQIGMDDWLGKPFDRALLSATIRRWVPPTSPPPSPSSAP